MVILFPSMATLFPPSRLRGEKKEEKKKGNRNVTVFLYADCGVPLLRIDKNGKPITDRNGILAHSDSFYEVNTLTDSI